MNRPSSLLCCQAARWLGVMLVWTVLPPSLPAQIAVSSITTSTTDLANTVTNGATFENTTTAITSFKDAAGNVYDTNTVAGSAFIRRNTTGINATTGVVNATNASMWYDQGTPTTEFSAAYASTYSSMLLGNNIYRGADNVFSNGTTVSDGNIERMDFVFSATGITATAATSFAIFDRGLVNAHDAVKIAVITGWNSGTSAPTAYSGNLVSVVAANYGTTNVVADFAYNLFRYNNSDNLSTWTVNTETGTQGIGGTVISMSDLGITAGTTIYGYSLMAADVTTGGSMANLVDWNNATYYATNTTTAGGIDLSAVNGVLYNRRVPEPSTYGAIFLGVSGAFLSWRRWRRRISAPAA
jgi:hypothetical protein